MTNLINTSNSEKDNSLVYQGMKIKEKGEMLSLTDMWKASSADDHKAPAQWMRTPQASAFVEAVSFNVCKSHNEIVTTSRGGRNPGTFAHWQIGLAYAKYLSPEFHIWCNQVVRDRMEGKAVATQHNLTNYDISIIGNVVKNCTALVVQQQLETLLPDMVEARLAKHNFLLREGKTAKQIWDSCNLPPKIKGSTTWFGNRLKEMSCSIENEGRADAGSGRSIRLFDPDKASLCLKNGLLHKSKVYASERMGQSKLRLVGQA
jgi:hypothetical protein